MTINLTLSVLPFHPRGGLFFAEPMRNNKYVTMMDPFQIKYGKVPAAALSLASLISEIMWVTGTLIGLGKNVSICGCEAFDTVC